MANSSKHSNKFTIEEARDYWAVHMLRENEKDPFKYPAFKGQLGAMSQQYGTKNGKELRELVKSGKCDEIILNALGL